jgi:hypothetical protein
MRAALIIVHQLGAQFSQPDKYWRNWKNYPQQLTKDDFKPCSQPGSRHDTLDSNYSEFPNSSLQLDLGFGANYPEIPDSCIQAECLLSNEGCYEFRSSTRR